MGNLDTYRTATIGNVRRAGCDVLGHHLLSSFPRHREHLRLLGRRKGPEHLNRFGSARFIGTRTLSSSPGAFTCHRCTRSRPFRTGLSVTSRPVSYLSRTRSRFSSRRAGSRRAERLPSVGATDQLCTAYRLPRCSPRLPFRVDPRQSRARFDRPPRE